MSRYQTVANLSEIEQPRRSNCNLNMSNLSTVRHLGFD